MNARLTEGEPSEQPDIQRTVSVETPTHQLLDDAMKGPRMWARYFEEQLSLRFPTRGYDPSSKTTEATDTRKILGQLKSYEFHWLNKYAQESSENFRTLGLTEPEELSANNELTFHLINQHVMPHWYRIFDQRSGPKPDVRSLNAAQVKIAIESALLLKYRREREEEYGDGAYVDPQLADFDRAIALLQLMIDAQYEDLDDIIIAPSPTEPGSQQSSGFLVFNPDYSQRLLMTRLETPEQEQAEVSYTPGHLARIALAGTKISSLSFWPEFKSRDMLHTFMSAKTGIPQSVADDPAIEKTRQDLGRLVRDELYK